MKCFKHPDKDAAAMCEKCNLFYCGSCVLSSNGRCPSCGRALRSPESLAMDITPEDIYRGQGPPKLTQAINSLYIEPVRTIRRLRQNASLFNGVINVTILYIILTLLRVAVMFAILIFIAPLIPGGTGPQLVSAIISQFFSSQVLVYFLVGVFLGYGAFVIFWLVLSLILFEPAKLLGGKGTFVQQASLLSYAMLAVLPLFIFSSALIIMPYNLGLILAFLGNSATLIYALLLTIIIIKEINEFDKFTTVVSFLVSFFILILLSAVTSFFIFFNTIIDLVGKSLSLSM